MRFRDLAPACLLLLVAAVPHLRTGEAAMGDWRSDAPGVWRRITQADMPPPYATRSAGNPPAIVGRPEEASLRLPDGVSAALFASGLEDPRMVRVAPGGEIFVAESGAGRIRLMTAPDGAHRPATDAVFARGLDYPFGIAFWPPDAEPRFVYVAEQNRVVRYPWRPGSASPAGPAQVVVPEIARSTGGHVTRDVAFSPDGGRMYVSVGSANNDGPAEPDRAVLLSFDPEGGHRATFASGLRNCVSVAIAPGTGAPWCVVNERDGLGDNLPPDYATAVRQGGFYGWPWYYIGDHQDPRHKGEHPELAARVLVPDVLIAPHSAPLGLAFYRAAGPAALPAEYDGDLFVTLHGSWNRTHRTGYKLVRVKPSTGAYEDFAVGFVVSDRAVWGRPVTVAEAHDGSLLMTDDAGGVIWRIAPAGR